MNLFKRTNKLTNICGPAWHIAIAILMLIAGQAQAYTVEMTEKDLQLMVEQGFPIRHQVPFASLLLSKPELTIVRDTNRLRLALAVSAGFPNKQTSRGRAEVEGELGYDAARGEFHLRQPVLRNLQFDQLPAQYQQTVTTLVAAIARESLPIIVIYRLDIRDSRQAMTRRILKSVTVRDGKLVAELDF